MDNLKVHQHCHVENRLSIDSLVTFFKSDFASDYKFEGEIHDFAEIVVVISGKVGITADKNVYTLSAGQMILHPPGEFHAIWSDCGTSPQIMVISFRADVFPHLNKRVFTLSERKAQTFEIIFEKASKAFNLKKIFVESIKEGREVYASSVIKRIELLLLEIILSEDSTEARNTDAGSERYARIVSEMKSRMDSSLSLDELADACNMSVATLERIVSRYTNCGVMTYFMTLKMNRAEELLLSGQSVKEVSIALGFSNQNYFSSAFKKWFGYPPSSLRKIR